MSCHVVVRARGGEITDVVIICDVDQLQLGEFVRAKMILPNRILG
jgi:hypothetical protein